MSEKGSHRVVVAALSANFAIAVFKFIAAYLSRSSAMLAEAGHSLADTLNQIFLLIGMRRGARPATKEHPFGHGLETYFWSFMVALSIFSIGAGFSIHEGIEKIVHRSDPNYQLGSPIWAYVVLGASILLEGYSFFVAMKEFRAVADGRSVKQTLRETRDPAVLTVLLEDSAALFGLLVALVGIYLSQRTGNLIYDGAASILVGIALGVVAWFLARDTKSLLLGEAVPPDTEESIRRIVGENQSVCEIVHLRTMHLGPDAVIAAIKVHFRSPLEIRTLEVKINEIEAALRRELPILHRIYIEPGFDEQKAPV